MTSRICVSLLGLALAGSSIPVEATSPAASPAAAQGAIGRANDLTRALLRAEMAEQRIPGLQVSVIVRGRVVMSESYGVANIEQKVAASRQTLFPINSIAGHYRTESIGAR